MTKQMIRLIAVVVAAASCVMTVPAHDLVPGAPQSQPILLKGGDLYTVSDGVKPSTDLLFENGRITAIGENLTPPDNCQVVDVTGKRVYPGLIAAGSLLGIFEIEEERATLDYREIGQNNADVHTHVAYNPDSEILPTIRSNGVSTALVIPYGSLIRGQASLMNMDGWTKEDAAEALDCAMVMSWPPVRINTSPFARMSAEEQAKRNKENEEELYNIFATAAHYKKARLSQPDTQVDQRLEAMIPLFGGDRPLIVEADDARQINRAIDLADRYDLRIIIFGGFDSWRVADRLKEHDIPVIFNSRPKRFSQRSWEPQDLNYAVPARLYEAGVKFCITVIGPADTRNVAYEAAIAVAHGLPMDAALRSITLAPAEILGVADRLGSLEVGKKATIVVSDGDIMDHRVVNVTRMWIGGAAVDLSNKQKELYEKYKVKPDALGTTD